MSRRKETSEMSGPGVRRAGAALFLGVLLQTGCAFGLTRQNPPPRPPSPEYLALLERFPIELHGGGADAYGFPAGQQGQPLTMALALSAEALHFRAAPNPGSLRYVKEGVRWFLEQCDADGDGLPGWGLPDPWDAFQDGSENPPNHPYTVVTGFVLDALLESFSIPSLWSAVERRAATAVMKTVVLRWCRAVWQDNGESGYFWYSVGPQDARFLPHVAAIFLGAIARMTSQVRLSLSSDESRLIEDRIVKSIRAIEAELGWNEGTPRWEYIVGAPGDRPSGPNDLVHQALLLWGMENFRYYRSDVPLSWSTGQALASLESFWEGGRLFDYSRLDVRDEAMKSTRDTPAVLWGAGSLLAFLARWGNPERTEEAWSYVQTAYGPSPDLRIRPLPDIADTTFYPRQAVFVLLALAIRDFGR